jgi:hypothetical protein
MDAVIGWGPNSPTVEVLRRAIRRDVERLRDLGCPVESLIGPAARQPWLVASGRVRYGLQGRKGGPTLTRGTGFRSLLPTRPQ